MEKKYPKGSYYILQGILENLVGKSNYEVLGTLSAIYQNLTVNNSSSNVTKEEKLGLKSLLGEVILELNDSKKHPINYVFQLSDTLKYQENDTDFLEHCL